MKATDFNLQDGIIFQPEKGLVIIKTTFTDIRQQCDGIIILYNDAKNGLRFS